DHAVDPLKVQPISSYLDVLASQAHPEGGWGYAPGQAAHLEPTCLALLALSLEADRFADAIRQGRQALQRCALPDSTYRLERGREEAVWPTSLALFAQSVLGVPTAELKPTAARLLGLKGRVPEAPEAGELHDIDLKIIGWPWAEGNFSWAEPTAWACLALRRIGQSHHPRVEEGLRLLLDRASDEGGINYGNRRILGLITEPIPGPTAIMLLALQGHDHPRVAAAVQYLIKQSATDDLEHLCWIKLALETHRQQPGVEELLPRLDEAIVKAHAERADVNWVRPAPLRQALTALALAASERNLFRLPVAVNGKTAETIQPAPFVLRKKSLGQRLGAWFRGLAIKAAGSLRPVGPQSPVFIERANDYNADLAGVLSRQYEQFRERVPLKGKRVVLKPNLVEYHRGKVINTNPNVVAAVIELCQREGAAEVIVAEGPGHCRNVEYIVAASGLGDVLRHYKVPFIDLNHDEPVKTPNLGRLTGLEHLYLSKTIAGAEVLISLPKLKTHHWAGATLSLKNLFGTLPGICYGWPKNELHWRGIDNSIVDIALTRTPDLAIVDGIIGMEGDGPLNGTPKPLGALIMGSDLLAVDATCCRLMKLDPEQIGYLVLGRQKKLGVFGATEIQQLGEAIEAVAQPFTTVPHFQKICVGRSA
ncbi:MAG TPA: DUF362 domain-containing protein, partial [Gemmataceae bacterium]|nr:DUF362 domain-containing protein [Gemmataceae bacterium]